jgi:YgiT-type zinc finger domain-containing protein
MADQPEPEPKPETQTRLEQIAGPCPECQSGMLHLRHLTYFTRLDNELVSVPNFPAWVCDLCGRREYDGRARAWLNTLLNPETGRANPARKAGRRGQRPPRRPASDSPPAKSSN